MQQMHCAKGSLPQNYAHTARTSGAGLREFSRKNKTASQGPWGPCSKLCDTGSQTRVTITKASGSGKKCGPLRQSCNTDPCPTKKPTKKPTYKEPSKEPTGCPEPRVRTEWNTQTDAEKQEYMRQITRLMDGGNGEYEKFVDTHYHRIWNGRAHGGGTSPSTRYVFLPWHRAYLYEFENAVRAANEGSCFTIKYWDWRVDNFQGSTVPNIVRDMGGVGEECRFNQADWNYACDESTCSSQTRRRCLTRRRPNGGGSMCLPGTLQREVSYQGSFGRVHYALQYGCHVRPHTTFPASDMGSHESPFDPLFWSHHAMLDYAWQMSQDCGNGGKSSYDLFHGSALNQVLPGFGDDKLISSVDKIHTPNTAWDFNAYAIYQSDTVDEIMHGFSACAQPGASLIEQDAIFFDKVVGGVKKIGKFIRVNFLDKIVAAAKKIGVSIRNFFATDKIDEQIRASFAPDLIDSKEKEEVVKHSSKLAIQAEASSSPHTKLTDLVRWECSLPEERRPYVTRAEQEIFFIPEDSTFDICDDALSH